MGIKCRHKIKKKTQEKFHEIDKIVTGLAFETHNEIGRFSDEKIYQEILAEKCRNILTDVLREAEIILSYNKFEKRYYFDLLVDNGIIYELKTVKRINDAHKQQLINYLLLAGINHGKILNFRTSSVEYEFVSTTLNHGDRFDYSIDFKNWQEISSDCLKMKNHLIGLLIDWGAFLDFKIYNEALVFLLGGAEKVICPVQIYYQGKKAGGQKMQLLNNETVFHLSAISRAFKGYENNIRRLIRHTEINFVQWVNFNNHEITLKTIKK